MTDELDPERARRLLELAVANLRRDYPVHWLRVVESPSDLLPHRVLHPVFGGSFDWHSCVHQTWLIARLLRLFPGLPGTDQAEQVLDELITADGVATEAALFAGPDGAAWERPYGWAWLLLLDAELRGGRWAEPLRPLTEVIRGRWLGWLASARRPIRAGVHANSAFALGLGLDAARAVGDTELADACADAALRFFGGDRGYGGFEPDAADFVSPALTEADLMRRVVPDFPAWFDAFLPDLDTPRWSTLRAPIEVDDPADPYGSHLAGLALSRAWAWRGIAAALPADHRYADLAVAAAREHREVGLRYVFGYGYAAEHWLGTFAAYLDVGAL